jgi:hypothetical protein
MRARGCGCIGHPAFPAPSLGSPAPSFEDRAAPSGAEVVQQLGRIARRDREACLKWIDPSARCPGEGRGPYPLALIVAQRIQPSRNDTRRRMGPGVRRDDRGYPVRCCRPSQLMRVFETEQFRLLVIGEQLGVAPPRHDRLERFVGVFFRHVVFEFVAETRGRRGV